MILLNHNLQAFLSVAKIGTVHGAADALGLSQTAVTQRLRALERQLQATLFLRSRRGMKLTVEGEGLLRYCLATEELEGQALSQIQGAGTERSIHLTIAGPTSLMAARVTDQCLPLYAQWPNLCLNLMVSDSPHLLQEVRSGKVAMAIVSPHLVVDEMDSKMLRPERYLLVADARWKGRRLIDVLQSERIIDFDQDDPTTLNYLRKFKLEDKLVRPRIYVNNNECLIKMFAQGVGFGTLTQEIAKPLIDAGDLIALNGGEVMENPLALTWYPRSEMPKYFKSIIQAIK